ncbi:hypothetical protein [Streptomyces monomycini]|uniref:hypothetical protein n=1 Tax=Streptomyces monomycini TaxID=371720 RepID=UPI001EEBEBC9|nr:hypothetical protein [Streptomyces monomycini]
MTTSSSVRPSTLTGFVTTTRPELVRDDEGAAVELRFRLGIRVYDAACRYRRTEYHAIVLRDEHSDIALAYQHALHPGTRLHLHGDWRQRDDGTDGDATDEFVVRRLYTELAVPPGAWPGRVAARRETW